MVMLIISKKDIQMTFSKNGVIKQLLVQKITQVELKI